jgi:hypothetical protein
MNKLGLLAEIANAFPAGPLPETTIRQAQLSDQGMSREISEEEWEAEGAKDRGIPWPEIPDEVLASCDAALSHLDEDGFVYYLPAFLSYAVRHVSSGLFDTDWMSMHFTIFAVTDLSNYNLGRLKRLNDVQIASVIEFLRFVATHSATYRGDAEDALANYWLTPDAKRKTVIYAP